MIVVKSASIPGIMTCRFDHEVSKSTADYKWTGPKITPEVWAQVLGFFEWTYEQDQSESQVRLFVNAQGWKAWAFPQIRGTLMTTEEIREDEDFTSQWGDLIKDYEYYGTVHSHCKASAFQSGTDLNNEKNTDGIHITVGCLSKGEKPYDLHFRHYLQGFSVPVSWANYWDIGAYAKSVTPESVHAQIALHQMARVQPDMNFPEVWKSNYKPRPKVESRKTVGFFGSSTHWNDSTETTPHPAFIARQSAEPQNRVWDLRDAVEYILAQKTHDVEKIYTALELIKDDPDCREACRICWFNDVSAGTLFDALDSKLSEQLKEEAINGSNICRQPCEWTPGEICGQDLPCPYHDNEQYSLKGMSTQ